MSERLTSLEERAVRQTAPVNRGDFDADLGARYPLRILLAEDNAINRQVAVQYLERLGYACEVATNGAQVLEAVANEAFDLVLMDIQMPVMDGLEASRRIIADHPDRPLLVAFTASTLPEDRQRCAEAGLDLFVAKPVRLAELVQALKTCAILRGTPKEEEGPAVPAIDYSVIEKLEQFMGDQAEIVTLIDLFLHLCPDQVAQVKQAWEDRDLAALSRQAHTLKSSASNLGAVELTRRCAELEAAGQDADEARAGAAMPEVLAAAERAVAELEAEKVRRG